MHGADNGSGISDSGKRNVFGRGEKGLESPGSGLGLYLVDTLVTTYGGSVWIEGNDRRVRCSVSNSNAPNETRTLCRRY